MTARELPAAILPVAGRVSVVSLSRIGGAGEADSDVSSAVGGATPQTTPAATKLMIVPAVWSDVQQFIDAHHRHHGKPVGMKFCLAVAEGDLIVGVASVGRPVARAFQDGWTLEVNRTCVVDAPNANSMLYGAAWRAAKALGYRRLITYTQAGESGSSLRAAGWRVVAERPARPGWDVPSRPRQMRGVDDVARTLWAAS